MSDVEQRLIACFMLVFPKLSESSVYHASPASLEAWDSLATVNLLSVIEEEFGIAVPAEDIEKFVSYERILRYLQEYERGRPTE
jgi:acyl carrier protein